MGIYHDFFEKDQCRGVNAAPVQECREDLFNLGLLFKQISVNEWGVFVTKDELHKDKLLLWLETDSNALVFHVEIRQSDFFLYTDWPGYSPKESYVFETASDAVEGVALRGEFHYGVVPEEHVTLYKRDKLLPKRKRQTVGFLKLGFSKNRVERFWQEDINQPFRVMIRFHALKVFWEFVLIPRNYLANQILMLKEATGKMEFTSLEEFELMPGQWAYRGFSSRSVYLKECYEYRVQLWELKHTGKRLITAEVPLPQAGEFSIKASKENSKIITKYFYF